MYPCLCRDITESEALEMSETTELQEGVDGFFDRLNEAIDIVSEKLVEVAPEAAEAVLNLVQAKGIFHLVVAAPFVLGALVALFLVWSFTLKYHKQKKEEGEYYDPFIPFFPAGCATAVLLVCFFVAFFKGWTFYNWLSAFYPEGAIAFKALQAAGIDL